MTERRNKSSKVWTHEESIKNKEAYWTSLFSDFDLCYTGDLSPAFALKKGDDEFSSYGWFPNVHLNFAKELLSYGKDEDLAIQSFFENGKTLSLTYKELRASSVAFAEKLMDLGLKEGDVVAAYLPNSPLAVVAMLGTALIGAIYTSTSCDFGEAAVIDRFSEANPSLLVAVTSYDYMGKTIDLKDRLSQIHKALPSSKLLAFSTDDDSYLKKSSTKSLDDFPLYPFSKPLYIMYSSGTTGKPKAIVHSAGGTLLKHLSELGHHLTLKRSDRVFFYTTTGWMMWNWLVSSLAFGSAVILYDGAPTYPSPLAFFSRFKATHWGTSPKFLKVLQDLNFTLPPHHLDETHTLLSTGAPLYDFQYDYVKKHLASHLNILSISGGTDILGCFFFGLANQSPMALGMDVERLPRGEEGELVCFQSFPSRPLYFLNDEGGEKMRQSYFASEKGYKAWHHGDFIRYTESGSVEVLGRSDATLNPQGVRIGTAEIYRAIETIPWVLDSLCIGAPKEGDVAILLFIKMTSELTPSKKNEIKLVIKQKLSPRHMPFDIFAVEDIPYTRSGKKMELLVTRYFQRRSIPSLEAVANPECLARFQAYADAFLCSSLR